MDETITLADPMDSDPYMFYFSNELPQKKPQTPELEDDNENKSQHKQTISKDDLANPYTIYDGSKQLVCLHVNVHRVTPFITT